MAGLFKNEQVGKGFEQTPSRGSRRSKGTIPSTSTRRRSSAKTFNDTVMNSYDKYSSLPKKIHDCLSFTQFMGIPFEDDLMLSSPHHQPRTKQESIERKGSKGRGSEMMSTSEIDRKLFEDFDIHADPIGASLVGNNTVPPSMAEGKKEEFVTSSSKQGTAAHGKIIEEHESDFLSLTSNSLSSQDSCDEVIHERFDGFSDCSMVDFVSAIGEEQVVVDSIVDTNPIHEVKSEVSMNKTIHYKSDFVYFGEVDIEQCRRLNEDWLHQATQAKILVAQARQHLQRVKECHNHLDDARKQRESSIRSLFLPREEEDSKDVLKRYKHKSDFLSLISNSLSPNGSNLKPCIENIQVAMASCEVDSCWEVLHNIAPILGDPLISKIGLENVYG